MEEGYTNSPPPYYRVNSRVSKNRSPEEKEKPFQTPIQEFKVDCKVHALQNGKDR